MDTGSKFTTWNDFVQELEKYSEHNQVSYSVGLCRPVENANCIDDVTVKFEPKFKYYYARMVCSQGIDLTHDTNWKTPNEKGTRLSCSSSILVCVNKEKNALVIMEANLNHNHNETNKMLSLGKQLNGDERRMASVLLRAGVPLSNVQEFIDSQERRIDDECASDCYRQRLSLLTSMGNENQLLFQLDQLMAEDAGCVIELIDFDVVPYGIYFQTSEMKKRIEPMENVGIQSIQLITYKQSGGSFSVVSIITENNEMGYDILALSIVKKPKDSFIRNIVETFVKHNQGFCDSIKGIILDCDKDNADFIQLIFPQAHIAWSRNFIIECFENDVKALPVNVQHNLIIICKEIMNSSSEFDYDRQLKCILEVSSSEFCKQFLTHWDSCKEMWTQYKIDCIPTLGCQKAAFENDVLSKMHNYIKPDFGFSDIFSSLLSIDKKGEEESRDGTDKKREELRLNSCHTFYRCICVPEAYEAVICQLAIAENSCYNVQKSSSVIIVQRIDYEEEFAVDLSGTTCTCPFFTSTELPCEHIFATRKISDIDLCDESLIPLNLQVLGESVTLDSLAQSLSQGYVPSSAHHEERLKALQTVLRDILTMCGSHSYEGIGKDIILLRQFLDVIKDRNMETKSKSIASKKDANIVINDKSSIDTPLAKKRGRKSKKEKEMLAAARERASLESNENAIQAEPMFERRHNLRTNIKHKFVTRQLSAKLKSKGIVSHSDLDGTSFGILGENSGNKDNEFDNINIDNPAVQHMSLSAKDEDFVSIQDKSLKRDRSRLDSKYERYRIVKSIDEDEYSNDIGSYTGEVDQDMDNNDYVDLDYDKESDSSDAKRARLEQDLSKFLEGMSIESIQELMQCISLLEHFDERSQMEETGNRDLVHPVDFVIHACHKDKENLDFVIRNLEKQISDYNKFAYKVAACLILTAFKTGAEVSEIRESISDWPNHLPSFSASPNDDVCPPLDSNQALTVCGYKLHQADIETLNSKSELSSQVIHAYLEALAQRHNGKMFVIPFEVVHHWRNETYGEMVFKKVHLKTFEYLVLPIHCGAEFTSDETFEEVLTPQWMVLVANVHNRTVGMLNPRTEDKYVIAANGYILQWRRFMQIRSVLTGEMLSAWTTETLHCNKQIMDHSSGAFGIMNVESIISNVPPCVMTEAHIARFVKHVGITLRDTDKETTVLCVGGLECQQMAAQDTDWLQCQNCRAWWHRACCGLEEGRTMGVDRNKTFYCSPCKQRIASVKISTGKILDDGDEEEGFEGVAVGGRGNDEEGVIEGDVDDDDEDGRNDDRDDEGMVEGDDDDDDEYKHG